jgi:hypothetical protein
MLKWVRDLSETLGFVSVVTKSDNGGMVGKAMLLLDVKEAVNTRSTRRRKGSEDNVEGWFPIQTQELSVECRLLEFECCERGTQS